MRKIGMLASADVIEMVATVLVKHGINKVVVDPVRSPSLQRTTMESSGRLSKPRS
jgi:hydroxymethylpyrimidine/phosphomethylpyrimidine kinase